MTSKKKFGGPGVKICIARDDAGFVPCPHGLRPANDRNRENGEGCAFLGASTPQGRWLAVRYVFRDGQIKSYEVVEITDEEQRAPRNEHGSAFRMSFAIADSFAAAFRDGHVRVSHENARRIVEVILDNMNRTRSALMRIKPGTGGEA